MLNAIRMELFRLRKSLSFYVILFILILVTLRTVFILNENLSFLEHKTEHSQTQITKAEKDLSRILSLDMDSLITNGNKITLSDVLPAIFSPMFLVINAIFMVLYVCHENNSGFIKNIVNSVGRKWYLIISKVAAFSLYLFVVFVLQLIIAGIGLSIGLENFSLKISWELFGYLALLYLLYVAFAVFSVMVTTALKNTAFSMIIIILDCFGIFAAIDPLKELSKYFISINILSFSAKSTSATCIRMLFVSLLSILLYNAISYYIIEKRDIS